MVSQRLRICLLVCRFQPHIGIPTPPPIAQLAFKFRLSAGLAIATTNEIIFPNTFIAVFVTVFAVARPKIEPQRRHGSADLRAGAVSSSNYDGLLEPLIYTLFYYISLILHHQIIQWTRYTIPLARSVNFREVLCQIFHWLATKMKINWAISGFPNFKYM